MSKLPFGALILGASCGVLTAVTAGPVDPLPADRPFLEREALIQDVLEENPSIEAAREAWRAAVAREPQVTGLEDPSLSYRLAPLSIGADAVDYGQVVQFSQPLPYKGKRRLRGEVARAEAEAARLDYEGVRLQLATLASLLFDDYYVVHRSLEINAEHVTLLEEFRRIATARYAAGAAAQQDPIQAEVELAHLLHREVVLRTRQRTVATRINALLHRRPEAGLPPPPGLLALPEPGLPDPVRLQEEALQARPDLRARDALIEARETGLRLRELDARPDFAATASFNSMWGEPDYRWTIGVGIQLPVYRDRIRAGVAEADARLRAARSQRSAREDAIRAEVQTACEEVEEARQVVELYRSRLMPASADQVSAALSGFKASRNSFLALIEAERNRRSVALGYHESLADYHRRRAELNRAVGRMPTAPGTPGTADGVINPGGDAR